MITRAHSLVLGALVADAASLGLHWLYEPARLTAIAARGEVAFLEPDPANYRDCRGTFVHGAKRCGELSGYGEYCALMLRHLATHGGHFDGAAYQTAFLHHFGPGGAYVGYVDKPTRGTLLRLMHVGAGPFPVPSGVDDDQLPALATLPPLLVAAWQQGLAHAELPGRVEQVVRVTSDNDTAVAAAQVAAVMLHALLQGRPRLEALRASASLAPPPLADALHAALAGEHLDATAAAAHFGASCAVTRGLPVAYHIIARASGYAEAIRANIIAGGDSCGRAILIGAALALADHDAGAEGIPLPWLARLAHLRDFADAATRLCGASSGGNA